MAKWKFSCECGFEAIVEVLAVGEGDGNDSATWLCPWCGRNESACPMDKDGLQCKVMP